MGDGTMAFGVFIRTKDELGNWDLGIGCFFLFIVWWVVFILLKSSKKRFFFYLTTKPPGRGS